MKIVCISDTHGQHDKCQIPEGDLLLHAGDLSRKGEVKEIAKVNEWLGTLPHPHKVVIAGNHDFLFEQDPVQARALLTNAHYLEDEMIEIEGIKIWGSPITPKFLRYAFNRKRGEEILAYWQKIPEDIDILITHGPPYGILDRTFLGKRVGCKDLREELKRIKPKVHLFGHIHEARGESSQNGITFLNASMLNLRYKPVHEAIVLEW